MNNMTDAEYLKWYAGFSRDLRRSKERDGWEPPDEYGGLLLKLLQRAQLAWHREVWPKVVARREAKKAEQATQRRKERQEGADNGEV